MTIEEAIQLVRSNEWYGDIRVNFKQLKHAAELLADEVEEMYEDSELEDYD